MYKYRNYILSIVLMTSDQYLVKGDIMLVFIITFLMIFAVLDPSPLTLWINCSFYTYWNIRHHWFQIVTISFRHANISFKKQTTKVIRTSYPNRRWKKLLIVSSSFTLRDWNSSEMPYNPRGFLNGTEGITRDFKPTVSVQSVCYCCQILKM